MVTAGAVATTAAQVLPLGGTAVSRLGYGSMQLTGEGHWGAPEDPDEAIRVLRHAVDSGVTHIDTADAYGPVIAEKYIRKALWPYTENLTIATKGGLTRQGPNQWAPVGRPEYLRQCIEMSLRRLVIERIELYYLHRIDPQVPFEEQLGVLVDMQVEGKIGHIGLSKVDLPQLRDACEMTRIAAVQNKYNLADRTHEDVLRYCEVNDIAFVPYAPLASGALANPPAGGKLDELARTYEASPAQLALAWLLGRSPVIMPIPGTKSRANLTENLAASEIDLTADDCLKIGVELSQSLTH